LTVGAGWRAILWDEIVRQQYNVQSAYGIRRGELEITGVDLACVPHSNGKSFRHKWMRCQGIGCTVTYRITFRPLFADGGSRMLHGR
jgi:hypothetical protein